MNEWLDYQDARGDDTLPTPHIHRPRSLELAGIDVQGGEDAGMRVYSPRVRNEEQFVPSDEPPRKYSRGRVSGAPVLAQRNYTRFVSPQSAGVTRRTLENPLCRTNEAYLRRWFADFPTEVQLRQLRNLRMQFMARLAEVA